MASAHHATSGTGDRLARAPPPGRLRDKCLNEHWFLSLGNPLRIVEPWREDYIIEGSLGTLAYQPQAEVQQALVELRIREQQMTFPRKSWSSPEVRIPVLGLTRTAGRL